MAKQIRQKIVNQQQKEKKSFEPGQFMVGILITIVSVIYCGCNVFNGSLKNRKRYD